MKTKSQSKPKPRSKAAKILFLKRSGAGKTAANRRRLRDVAKKHILVSALLLFVMAALGSYATVVAADLIPPKGDDINMDTYIRAAQAKRALDREAARQAALKASTFSPAPPAVAVPVTEGEPDQTGIASWYALGLRNPDARTCASTKFPRGTYLKVRDLRNSREVVCLVNDYGPQPGTKRVIDLSRGSYKALEWLGSGTMPVEIWVVSAPQ